VAVGRAVEGAQQQHRKREIDAKAAHPPTHQDEDLEKFAKDETSPRDGRFLGAVGGPLQQAAIEKVSRQRRDGDDKHLRTKMLATAASLDIPASTLLGSRAGPKGRAFPRARSGTQSATPSRAARRAGEGVPNCKESARAGARTKGEAAPRAYYSVIKGPMSRPSPACYQRAAGDSRGRLLTGHANKPPDFVTGPARSAEKDRSLPDQCKAAAIRGMQARRSRCLLGRTTEAI